MIRRAAALACALLLAGCHPGTFSTAYSIAWPRASNDVRAWGTRLMATARQRWHGAVTVDATPAYFAGRGTQGVRDLFAAAGYLRVQGGRSTFTPAALRASTPCGAPEFGAGCRRFTVGRLTTIEIEDYRYASKTIETGIAFRTLTFRFRATPAGGIGTLLATHRALFCQTGERITPIGSGTDRGEITSPVYTAWTPATWCSAALETDNGAATIPTLGPLLPIPGLTGV